MDCSQISQFLHSYLDQELDQRDTTEIELHLSQCPRCRGEAGYFRRLRSKLREVCPHQLAPVHLEASLRAKLRVEAERNSHLPRLLLAAASVFVFFLGGWYLWPTSSPQAPLTAASGDSSSSFFPPNVVLPVFDPAGDSPPPTVIPDSDPRLPSSPLSKEAKKQRCLMRKLRWLRERQMELKRQEIHPLPPLSPPDPTPHLLPVKAP